MAFINEYIPAEDVMRYAIERVDEDFPVGCIYARDWTIDRDREIYLRKVAKGREDTRNQIFWSFYWREQLITLRLDMVDGGGAPGQPGWSHWKLQSVNGHVGLPFQLTEGGQFLTDLGEALTAYKDGGVFSRTTTYEVRLEVASEVSP